MALRRFSASAASAPSAIESRQRILLADAPLCPFKTGRQPSRDDRTDWVD